MGTTEAWQRRTSRLSKTPNALHTLMLPKNLSHFFKCMDGHCSFSTSDDDLFLVHLSAHREQMPLCVYCGRVAANGARLVKHMITAHSHCRVQCSLCFYRARTKVHLVVHAAIVHEATIVHWYVCRDITPPMEEPISPGDLNEMFYRCANGRTCQNAQTCRFLCLTTETFHQHLWENHSGCEWYSCHLCKEHASSPSSLTDHYAHAHGFETVQCLHCDFGHASEWMLLKHVMEEHADKPFRLLLRSGRAPILWNRLKALSARLLSRSIITECPKMSEDLDTASQVDLTPSCTSEAVTCQLTKSSIAGKDFPSSSGPAYDRRKCHLILTKPTEFTRHSLGECSTNQELSSRMSIYKNLLQELPKEGISADSHYGMPDDKLISRKKICDLHKDSVQELHPLQESSPMFQVTSIVPKVCTGQLHEQRENSSLQSAVRAKTNNAVTNGNPSKQYGIDCYRVEHYVCVLCCKKQMKKSEYFQHMSTSHEMRFFCGHCEKSYKVAKELLGHLQRHHSEQPFSAKRYWCNRLLDITPHMLAAWKQRWQGCSQRSIKQAQQQPGPPPEGTTQEALLACKCGSANCCSSNIVKLSTPGLGPRRVCHTVLVKPAKRHTEQSLSALCKGNKWSALEKTSRRKFKKSQRNVKEKSGIMSQQPSASEMIDRRSTVQPSLKYANCCQKVSPRTCPGTNGVLKKTLLDACFEPECKGTGDMARLPDIRKSQTGHQPASEALASKQGLVERKSLSDVSLHKSQMLNGKRSSCKSVILISDSEDNRHSASRDVIILNSDSEDDRHSASHEVIILNSDTEDEVSTMRCNGFSYYSLKPRPLDCSRLFVWNSDLRIPYSAFASMRNCQPRLIVRRLCVADFIG